MKAENKFSTNAVRVLKQRCLLRDEKGNIVETPEEMMRRVAHCVAQADKNYTGFNPEESEKKFYELLNGLDFLPDCTTIANAGGTKPQLAEYFAIPIEDSLESIFDAVKKTALIQQTGGEVSFNFSKIRPKGDIISTTHGFASGLVSFMKIFDTVITTIKRGSRAREANIGVLNVNHPDILEFITCKENGHQILNFNLFVSVTDKFMEAVEKNEEYELINPHTNKAVNRLNANDVFELIIANTWKNGETGIIFLGSSEKDSPFTHYEALNFGAIKLPNFVKNTEIDWQRLGNAVNTCVHFLDNVIDVCDHILPEINKTVLEKRKIGVGIMGFADMLLRLGIPYNSENGIQTAEKLIAFIQKEAKKASIKLGELRGSFPNFAKSIYPEHGVKYMRNATVTTIAPTKTLSIIADCSPGIEPLYSFAHTKEEFYKSDFIYTIKIQAVFQKHTDNVIFETINLSATANVNDIKKAYTVAHRLKCKGIQIYMDQSRKTKVSHSNHAIRHKEVILPMATQ